MRRLLLILGLLVTIGAVSFHSYEEWMYGGVPEQELFRKLEKKYLGGLLEERTVFFLCNEDWESLVQSVSNSTLQSFPKVSGPLLESRTEFYSNAPGAYIWISKWGSRCLEAEIRMVSKSGAIYFWVRVKEDGIKRLGMKM